VSDGPTEAVNSLIKRMKSDRVRVRRFAHCRIRVLFYAGVPNWDLFPAVTHR
jgi:transposase